MVYPSESRSRSWFKSRKTVCVRFRTRNHGLQGRSASHMLCKPGLTRCISRSTRFPKHRIVGLAILLVVFATFSLFVLSARRADHVGRALRHTQHVGPLDAWEHILFQDDEADDGGDLISQEDHVFSRQTPEESGIARWQEGMPGQPLFPRPGSNTSIYAKYAKTPNLLRRSILYPGSGNDLLRVLQKAANLSRNAFKQDTQEALNDPFRVMVMGGSGEPCFNL